MRMAERRGANRRNVISQTLGRLVCRRERWLVSLFGLAVYQRFLADRTEVVGAIVNDWDPESSSRGYYGYGYKYDTYYQRRG
jgi:hypothetical protein